MSEEFDKDGLLWKRVGSKPIKKRKFGQKKWSLVYVNLISGSLNYYKDEEDEKPKGSIELNELTLHKDDTQGSSSKKHCFSLKNDTFDFLFACEEEAELNAWVAAIEANMKKDSAPALKKEKRKTRAQALAFKAKKNMAVKMGTSAVGKKALRGSAPDEVKNLIGSIKHIVELSSKSKSKAVEIEDNIFKIGIKCYFLVEDKRITIDDLLVADKPLRQALELLSRCYDHAKFARNVNKELLGQKFGEVNKMLMEAAEKISNLVGPHLKPKNVDMVRSTIEYLGDPERLMQIFMDPAIDEDLQELISAGEHYTQFHFYSEK